MAAKRPTSKGIHVDDLVKEAENVKAYIRQLSDELTRPELELGTSLRLNVEQRELEAYLCGLLYALGEGPPLDKSSAREA